MSRSPSLVFFFDVLDGDVFEALAASAAIGSSAAGAPDAGVSATGASPVSTRPASSFSASVTLEHIFVFLFDDFIDVDIALQTFDDRRFQVHRENGFVCDFAGATTGFLSLSRSTVRFSANRQFARPLGSHHHELKTIRDFNNVVFDDNAGHSRCSPTVKDGGT